jgi:hypothetical protein
MRTYHERQVFSLLAKGMNKFTPTVEFSFSFGSLMFGVDVRAIFHPKAIYNSSSWA